VHVYSLIANHRQDVFLNHIAFSKGTISEAFTNTTPSSFSPSTTTHILAKLGDLEALFEKEDGETEEESDREPIAEDKVKKKQNSSVKSKERKQIKEGKENGLSKKDKGSSRVDSDDRLQIESDAGDSADASRTLKKRKCNKEEVESSKADHKG